MKPILYFLILFIFIFGCAEEPNSSDASNNNSETTTTSSDSTTEEDETTTTTTTSTTTTTLITDTEDADDSDSSTEDEGVTETTTTTTSTTTTTTLAETSVIITQSITTPPIKFAVQTTTEIYFFNGINLNLWKSGTIKKVGSNEFVVNDTIYNLTSEGIETSSTILPKIPTAIKRTDSGVVWCYQYTKQEAYAMGGQPKPYSAFYLDNTIISQWYFNQFECKSIESIGTDVFAVDQNGGYHTITGSYTNVFHADNLIMHSLDTLHKTIGFNSNTENYGFNYAMNSRQWILYNNIYYAENGYTWTETGGLIENGTVLHGWNAYPYPLTTQNPFGEALVLLKVGISNHKLYWIECNSGFLFEYDSNTDALTQKSRLYISNGLRSTGIYFRGVLKPFLMDHILYYSEGGAIHSLDINTGSLNIFYANVGEVVRYD